MSDLDTLKENLHSGHPLFLFSVLAKITSQKPPLQPLSNYETFHGAVGSGVYLKIPNIEV